MQESFHGTDPTSAAEIQAGNVDVTRGGGELGRGFYTGSSVGRAAMFGLGAGASDEFAVVKFEVAPTAYKALKRKRLSLKAARSLTQRLRAKSRTGTYLFNKDCVIAPCNGSRRHDQAKFETASAEAVLNGPQTARTIV